MSAHLTLILVTLFSFSAWSETYEYAGALFTCELNATKQVVGGPVVTIGQQSQTFALQLFKGEALTPRFTGISTGSKVKADEMLVAGGIPNLKADSNWNVLNDVKSVSSYVTIGDFSDFTMSFRFHRDNSLEVVAAKGQLRWSMEQAQRILRSLGDIGTPDFRLEPPQMNSTEGQTYDFELYMGYLIWSKSPWDLKSRVTGVVHTPSLDFQLHYPPTLRDGLSYHIKIVCSGDAH